MGELLQSFKEWIGISKSADRDLNRSHYSLVSCGDVTKDTIQLWLGLPDEVKNDPALEQFRQLYEKDYADVTRVHKDTTPLKKVVEKKQRLPVVNSAPVLGQNISEVEFLNGVKKGDVIEERQEEKEISPDKPLVFNRKQAKISEAKYYIKMTILLACWLCFTAIFLTYNEKKDVYMMSSINPGEVKNYTLPFSEGYMTLVTTLTGPFLSESGQITLNSTEYESRRKVVVRLERRAVSSDNIETSEPQTILLQGESDIDFNEGEDRFSKFSLPTSFSNDTYIYSLLMNTTATRTVPFTLTYKMNPLDGTTGVVYACVLLCGLYILIIFEVINRTMAAIIICTMSLAALALAGERPTLGEVVSWLDQETLLLLFSMMLLVAIMAETGIFDYIAVFTFEVTKGKLWPLIYLLCGITAVCSTFLDNVTTVLLMSPVTIRLCEVMDLDPVPILMFMAIYSNIGGTATPVGDPPNVIVVSNKAVIQAASESISQYLRDQARKEVRKQESEWEYLPKLQFLTNQFNDYEGNDLQDDQYSQDFDADQSSSYYLKPAPESGINFTNFTAHMAFGILFVCIQTSLQIRYIFRDSNKLRLSVPREIQDITNQISIWRRAADSLPHLSKDVHIVRERLERKIRKLSAQLETMIKESSRRACPKDTFKSTLVDLKGKYKIRDKVLLIKSSVAIAFVVIVFFLHSIPELNRISLGWTALLGAILLLTLADREDLEPILHRVEWSTLLFFAALFVTMEALSKLGLIVYIGGLMEMLILQVDETNRLAVALMLILWVSGTISAFVDNIPLTTMMVRIVVSIGSNPNLNLPMAPLIWALLFGACLGGNGTLIGASANVVCAGVAEQHGYKFTFTRFFKVGFPVMIGHLIVASVYLLII